MKSLAELEAIRKATLSRINVRKEEKGETTRVVVGMATCGIAAGARPVMLAFVDEIQKRHARMDQSRNVTARKRQGHKRHHTCIQERDGNHRD